MSEWNPYRDLLPELRRKYNEYEALCGHVPEVIVMRRDMLGVYRELVKLSSDDAGTWECFYKGTPVVAQPEPGVMDGLWRFYPEECLAGGKR